MNKQVFVTGTDTDVGKTLVSTILTVHWQATYWKPIQAGTAPSTDRGFVSQWVPQQKLLPEHYLLQTPCSPNQAATRENLSLSLDQMELPQVTGPLVVEGAGGLMVPINDHELMIDLIKKCGLPVVLVARSTLGTLNHTLLSIEAMRARNIHIAGVVFNGPAHPENQRDIEHFGKVKTIGRLPENTPHNDHTFRDIAASWNLDLR